MKKVLIILGAILLTFSLAGHGAALIFSFDFEDDTNTYGKLNGLNDYIDNIFGSHVRIRDAVWFGESAAFGSDVLYTKNQKAVLDFDPAGSGLVDFKITAVSFTWGVYDQTWGRDWGLDVYDDAMQGWRNNVFDIHRAQDGDSGESPLIEFDAAWQITRLRWHDSGQYDVMLDNLTIHNSRGNPTGHPVPEPATILLLGIGLAGLGAYSRKKIKKE